jgi:hypothetical protein
MSELNYESWLEEYKKENPTWEYLGKKVLEKAFQKAEQRLLDAKIAEEQRLLDAKIAEEQRLLDAKIAEEKKQQAEEKKQQADAKKREAERLKEKEISLAVENIKRQIDLNIHYLNIDSILEYEKSYERLIAVSIDNLSSSQKEFMISMTNIKGRDEYIKAKTTLDLLNLQKEQINILKKAFSLDPSNTQNSSKADVLAPMIAGSALLINKGVREIGEDVDSISEGFGFG